MSVIQCSLLYHSLSSHLQQLYTGFMMLQKSGIIGLTQQVLRNGPTYANQAPHLTDADHAHLTVIVNGTRRVHFDTHDAMEVAISEAEECEFYFKRSYSSNYVGKLPERIKDKIFPLGLNYNVLPDLLDLDFLRRSLMAHGSVRDKVAALKQALDVKNLLGFQPRVNVMEAAPNNVSVPKVLFLTAAYDPYDDPARSEEKIADRRSINKTRADCIRLLRRGLGPYFVGGFVQNKFSVKEYGELVVPLTWTTQQNYIKLLKSYPICMATTGLHGSIGWKLAEYVAFSKAIVSEKLRYEVPGRFEPGRNYLEFTSPEECLSAAKKLIEDGSQRNELMRNNAAYYQSHVRPDALVMNALNLILK